MLLFFSFQGCSCGIWKFLGWGPNWTCVSAAANPGCILWQHRILTHWVWQGSNPHPQGHYIGSLIQWTTTETPLFSFYCFSSAVKMNELLIAQCFNIDKSQEPNGERTKQIAEFSTIWSDLNKVWKYAKIVTLFTTAYIYGSGILSCLRRMCYWVYCKSHLRPWDRNEFWDGYRRPGV